MKLTCNERVHYGKRFEHMGVVVGFDSARGGRVLVMKVCGLAPLGEVEAIPFSALQPSQQHCPSCGKVVYVFGDGKGPSLFYSKHLDGSGTGKRCRRSSRAIRRVR